MAESHVDGALLTNKMHALDQLSALGMWNAPPFVQTVISAFSLVSCLDSRILTQCYTSLLTLLAHQLS